MVRIKKGLKARRWVTTCACKKNKKKRKGKTRRNGASTTRYSIQKRKSRHHFNKFGKGKQTSKCLGGRARSSGGKHGNLGISVQIQHACRHAGPSKESVIKKSTKSRRQKREPLRERGAKPANLFPKTRTHIKTGRKQGFGIRSKPEAMPASRDPPKTRIERDPTGKCGQSRGNNRG